MPNAETDTLALVTSYTVPEGNWFLPKPIRTDVGYSLQIFTGGGQYRGQVDESLLRVNARRGDVVLRVNLGMHLYTFIGDVTPRDGHVRKYALTLKVQVVDPEAFAIAYRQQRDPLNQLRGTISGKLNTWAVQLYHDDLTPDALRFRVGNAALLAQGETGLRVQEVVEVKLYLSEHVTRLREITLQAELAKAQHHVEVAQHAETREETARDRDFERQQSALDATAARANDELNAQTHIRIEAQQRIASVMVNEYEKRLAEGLAAGLSLDELLKHDPALVGYINQLTAPTVGTTPALPSSGISGASGQTSDGSMVEEYTDPGIRDQGRGGSAGSTGRTAGSEERYDPYLGVRYSRASLTAEQSELIDHQPALTIRQVFEVIHLDEGGPAMSAYLALGDLIVQVEGQMLRNADAVTQLTSAIPPTAPARLLILRQDQLIEMQVYLNRATL